jgi:hypothetical protein
MEMAAVLWRNDEDMSSERCRLVETHEGFALEGTVLVPVGGQPARVDYLVEASGEWVTRRAQLTMQLPGGDRGLALESDGAERWTLDEVHQPHLDGCLDVDIRLTPATNTLPIRRLAPAVGETVETRVAWVGFPDLELEPSVQTYERIGERLYRFRAGEFVADLEVDEVGMVLRYGDDFWISMAHHRP